MKTEFKVILLNRLVMYILIGATSSSPTYSVPSTVKGIYSLRLMVILCCLRWEIELPFLIWSSTGSYLYCHHIIADYASTETNRTLFPLLIGKI
jgi:hypothetical protein